MPLPSDRSSSPAYRSAHTLALHAAAVDNDHQHNIATAPAGSFDACCELCTSTAGCTVVTFVSRKCYLKNATVGRTPLAGAVSGGVGKMPPLPPLPPRPPPAQGCDQGLRINGGGQ